MADEYAEAGDGSPAAKRRQVTATNFLSLDEINNAKEKKWINDWETTFYSENMAKESMSDKQMEIKVGRSTFCFCSSKMELVEVTGSSSSTGGRLRLFFFGA